MGLQHKTRKAGMMSMLEDLAGERLKIRPTSSNVTVFRVESHCGREMTNHWAQTQKVSALYH